MLGFWKYSYYEFWHEIYQFGFCFFLDKKIIWDFFSLKISRKRFIHLICPFLLWIVFSTNSCQFWAFRVWSEMNHWNDSRRPHSQYAPFWHWIHWYPMPLQWLLRNWLNWSQKLRVKSIISCSKLNNSENVKLIKQIVSWMEPSSIGQLRKYKSWEPKMYVKVNTKECHL